MRRDRISKLPDELIHHILAFLPSKLAVQTSVLSTRWRSVWASCPHLCFDNNDLRSGYLYYPDRLGPFVDAMLLYRDRSAAIKTFCLHAVNVQTPIRNWILYALRYDIEELDVALSYEDGLPESVLTCKSLTTLRLETLRFKSDITTVDLGKLTTLHLTDIHFQGSSLSRLVGGCPNLEDLLVEDCIFEELRVASGCARLRTLSLAVVAIRLYNADPMPRIEIKAPRLFSLRLSMHPYFPQDDYPCGFSQILEGFRHVQELELMWRALEYAYKEVASSRILPTLHKLRQLKLDAILGDRRDVQAINGLLNCSPELKVLVINDIGHLNGKKPRKARDLKSELSVRHLKSVKINMLTTFGTAEKLSRFMLSSSRVMKTIFMARCKNVYH